MSLPDAPTGAVLADTLDEHGGDTMVGDGIGTR